MDAEITYLHPKDEVESLKINSITNPTNQENAKNILPINYTQSSFFSKIFYFWANPVIALANKRPLEKEDVCKISKFQKVSNNFEKFKKIFHKQSMNNYSSYPLFSTISRISFNSFLN